MSLNKTSHIYEASGDLSENKSVIPDSLQDHLSHTFLSVTMKRRKENRTPWTLLELK